MVLLKNTIFRKGNLVLSLFCILSLLLFNLFIFSTETLAGENKSDEYFAEDMLIVGMVDLTVLFNSPNNIEEIDIGDQFKEEIVVNGRTAFFLKGKIKGKYLLTARVDTGQGKIKELWQDLFSQNSGNSISRIDPERYYPVYGDNSSVTNMVNSQGKLYANLTWEESEILWGDYAFNINDNQLIRYNRSLYGLRFKTANKDDGIKGLKGFWSKPESIHSYNELKLTGGMLYYLKHGNLLVGSENMKIEIRDDLTAEVLETMELANGIEYNIDYLSGRIILNNSIIGQRYLFDSEEDEKTSYLIADYEYEPIGDIGEKSSYGMNMKIENKKTEVSGTYITETTAAGKNYKSLGAAYNYRNDGSNFIVELANTQDIIANQYFSEDGGMTYSLISNTGNVDSANAYSVQYQTNLNNIYPGLPGIAMNVKYNHQDEGFSTQRQGIKEDTDSLNLSFKGIYEGISYTSRYFSERKKESGQSDVIDLKVSKKVNENLKLAGDIRQQTTIDENEQENSQLSAGMDFKYQLDENKQIYGNQKLSLTGGNINKTTLGAEIKPVENITLDVAVTLDNSDSFDTANNRYKVGGSYHYKYGEVYSAFTTKGTGDSSLILGGNTTLNENTDLYVEHKNSNDINEDSESNVLGVTHNINDKWALALDYSRSNVIKEDKTDLSRDIITPSVVYRDDDLNYRAKMEYRQDQGDQKLTQYVLTSGLDMTYNEELSALFNLDYSLTRRDNDIDEQDSFIEAQMGMAYRPVHNDRLNLLAMYTYQEEFKPEEQENVSEYNEKSNIFSIEGIYDLNASWQLSEKLAWKNSQVMVNGVTNVSDTYLWINRLAYQLQDDWELYGEYRMLKNIQAKDQKSGFLVGVNKGLRNNLKLVVGYNFTDFNDDLTDLDYNYRGLFVNLVKKW